MHCCSHLVLPAVHSGIGCLLLAVGFVGGWFTAKAIGTQQLTTCYASQAGNVPGSRVAQSTVAHTRGMPTDGLALRQLPPPWSQEAQQLRRTGDSQGE
jgi:hypothetical protein